ncbi:MAG TPA: deoxynucleoside kinase, partial [Solirubrobacteraceae bacterium]|nr:deoxynucleoside kinase [Solirubrobacteraceae bacterium]
MNDGARILVVAGNIAAGKTHLLDALGSALQLPTYPERWSENPWFDAELRDAFSSQLWFLLAAASDHALMSSGGGVQERCIDENAQVFARVLLDGDELALLEAVYARLDARLPDPTLLIHLTASPETLLERIRERGRAQERSMTVDYLRQLGSHYRTLIDGWSRCPVIEIDTEVIDVR